MLLMLRVEDEANFFFSTDVQRLCVLVDSVKFHFHGMYIECFIATFTHPFCIVLFIVIWRLSPNSH